MKYKRILVPTDLSGSNKKAFSRAMELKSSNGGELIAVHIVDYVPPNYVMPEISEQYGSKNVLVEHAKEALDKMLSDRGIEATSRVVRVGNAKRQLIAIAEEHDVDLIIITKHGISGIERLLGSTTNAVVQKAGCDVLVVNADEKP